MPPDTAKIKAPQGPLLSVVVPVYNEHDTVLPLLERVQAVDLGAWALELIVVDDGSTDGTGERLAAASKDGSFQYLQLPHNRGKGAAVRTGIAAVSGDAVLIQDADLEYDPADIPALLAALEQGDTPVVYGSRILHPDNTAHSALRFYLGGRLVTLCTNLLFGSHLTDEPTGYKLFRTATIRSIPLVCERFEFCPEVTAKLLRRKIPIVEVPIRYYPRKPGEGKKIGWWDGVEAIQTLVRWRFARF